MEEIQCFIIGVSEDEAPMNATAALHRAQYNLLPEVKCTHLEKVYLYVTSYCVTISGNDCSPAALLQTDV